MISTIAEKENLIKEALRKGHISDETYRSLLAEYCREDVLFAGCFRNTGNDSHPHWENMMLYAEDAKETSKPWERWEFSIDGDCWHDCITSPSWVVDNHYRRKIENTKDLRTKLEEVEKDNKRLRSDLFKAITQRDLLREELDKLNGTR